MQSAQFFEKISNDEVKCTLCNHFCIIKKNKTGICRARLNLNNTLYSLNYGYPIDMNADPIEKKPLFHFFPATQTFSIGALGCNFKCANCLNHRLSQAEHIEKKTEEMDYFSPERIVENALADGCSSISYTYNEPTMWLEYALDIMKIAHENDLKNVWVSNGYMSGQALDKIIPYLDAVNIDLKSFDEDFYNDNCGATLQPVLKNLQKIKQEQVHLEITTLIIPTLSYDTDMLKDMADFIASDLDTDTPWHLSKFSPEISWKLKNLPQTGEDVLYEAHEIGKTAGLKYVYVGNMPGDQNENTYCPKCGEIGIRRFGYQIERLDSGGRCSFCDRDLDIIE
jgi:pyruvate formate lyase activating enzyme